MRILNNKAIDKFLWDHRENGCHSIKGEDEANMMWVDNVTGETVEVEHQITESDQAT